MADTQAADSPRSDSAVLEELLERYDDATTQWDKIRDEARIDMRYVAGDPWDPKDRAKRTRNGRPCLSLDELGQYFNAVVNDVRANPRSIKFSPAGGGANDRSAEFYANKTREIEYRSKSGLAYITAFENCVHRSYGFARIVTRYASERSFDLDLSIDMIEDPDRVTADPYAKRPDGLDQEFCFIEESRPWGEYRRMFPGAEVHSFSSERFAGRAGSWGNQQRVRIAEYWTIERRERELLRLTDGRDVFLDELHADKRKAETLARRLGVQRTRTVPFPYVEQRITNGIEILTPKGGKKVTPWLGKYIPLLWCLGKTLYVDKGEGPEKVILSMTRLARDPVMQYCYYRSAQLELAGQTPRFPYFVYEGQLAPRELANLKCSNEKPVAVIRVKPIVDAATGQVLPFPERNPYTGDSLLALEGPAEGARRAIQAAMGISPLPSTAQRLNQKSGKALDKIDAQMQRGSYHFVDHYQDMIEAAGVILEDLMDKVYDAARQTAVRQADDTVTMVGINDPENPDAYPTTGQHTVTISTGPNYDSERERASDFADVLVQIPPVAAQVMDLVIKLKGLGPIGDQIAERLTPPQYRKQAQQGGQLDPKQMAQSLAEAQAQLAELQQAAAAMKQALDTEAAKQAANVKIAEIKAQADKETAIEVQARRNAAAIRVAEIQAGVKVDAGASSARTEALALAHESLENELDRTHDLEMAERQHAQALEQGAAAADAGMVAQDQKHAQTLEQGRDATARELAALAAQPPAEGA